MVSVVKYAPAVLLCKTRRGGLRKATKKWVPCCLPSEQTLGDKEVDKDMKVNLTINVPNWLDRVCAWPVVMWRKWKDGEGYRKIELTDGKFAVVDEEDYYRLGNFGWCAKHASARHTQYGSSIR